jgi:histone deacetylase HOS3
MPDTAIFLQDACLQHKYIRSKDKSNVVERPERLRAINVGISGALARLESVVTGEPPKREADGEIHELTDVLGKMRIGTPTVDVGTSIAEIVKSQANVDLLDHEAVKFVHGDIEGDVYLENLKAWAKNSKEEIVERGSEIPEGLPQGDLYRWLFSLMKIGTDLKGVASMSRIYQRDSRRPRDSMRSR